MKKIIFSILTMIFVASGLFAQNENTTAPNMHGKATPDQNKPLTAAEKVDQRMSRIPQEANLTRDQHDKIRAVLIQYHSDLDGIKKANGGNISDSDAKWTELRKSLDQKIQAILSPEQYTIVKAALKQKSK